jgi:hypothetical protein
MPCYSLMLGARRTRGAGRRFKSADDARLRAITQRHFPEGFTIVHADGGWFDPAVGRFVAEESRQVLICTSHRRKLKPWCAELADALKQKELLVVELGRAMTFSKGGRSPTGPGRG